MQKFYGFASSRTEKDLWNKLVITKLINKMPIKWPGTVGINMTEFFERTSPSYFIYGCLLLMFLASSFLQVNTLTANSHCQFEHIDCRRFWTKVITINGVCIEFNPVTAIESYKNTMAHTTVKDQG